MATPAEQSVTLYFTGSGSDKFYRAYVVQVGDQWICRAENGKRGAAGTLQQPMKSGPGTFDQAKGVFDALVKKKVKDGYTTDLSGIPFTPSRFEEPVAGQSVSAPDITGVREHMGMPGLHLLTLIETREALEQKMSEPGWVWQIKMDGERRPIRKDGQTVTSGNKLGLIAPVHPDLVDAIRALPGDYLELDGEDMGDGKIALFDCMNVNGKDLRALPYAERWFTLRGLIAAAPSPLFVPIADAWTPVSALNLLRFIEQREEEGIVGKRANSPYSEGKASPRRATQIKFVLRQRDSFIVLAPVKNKSSVELGVVTANGSTRSVGNLTIPNNATMPATHSVVDASYRFAYPEGGLCMPVYERARPDVLPAECLESRLKMQKLRSSTPRPHADDDDLDEPVVRITTHGSDAERIEVLESIGYDIDNDSDQPDFFVWRSPTDGCDSSFATKADAIADAWLDAAGQAMAMESLADHEWGGLSFEQQKSRIAELGVEDPTRDSQHAGMSA